MSPSSQATTSGFISSHGGGSDITSSQKSTQRGCIKVTGPSLLSTSKYTNISISQYIYIHFVKQKIKTKNEWQTRPKSTCPDISKTIEPFSMKFHSALLI